MITRGIVEELLTPYQVRVRLPLLDGIRESRQGVPTSDLSIATICSLPNSKNNISVGDIVFVGFEDNDVGKPVIIGHLYRESVDETEIDLVLRKLSTSSTTMLSDTTYIGNVTPDEIKALQGVEENIQSQLDKTNEDLNNLRITSDTTELNNRLDNLGRYVDNNFVTLSKGTAASPEVISGVKKFKNDIVVEGNITQQGSNYITHAEQVYSTKDYIYLRENAPQGLADGKYSGFEFIKYDGVNNGRLVVDNKGIVYVGDVGDEQPLATREQTPIDRAVAYWDASESMFKTSDTMKLDNYLPLTGGEMEGAVKFSSEGFSTFSDSGFSYDQHGNMKHLRDTETDYFHMDAYNGTAIFSVYPETREIVIHGTLVI